MSRLALVILCVFAFCQSAAISQDKTAEAPAPSERERQLTHRDELRSLMADQELVVDLIDRAQVFVPWTGDVGAGVFQRLNVQREDGRLIRRSIPADPHATIVPRAACYDPPGGGP